MIFKEVPDRKEIKGEWHIEWLVSQAVPPRTFLSLFCCLTMPIEMAAMRADNMDELEKILREVLSEFEDRKTNGRTRFVGYIDRKEDHFIIGYLKNGREEINCLKVCIKP